MEEKIKVLLIDKDLDFHGVFNQAFKEIELFSSYSIEGGSWMLSHAKEKFDLIFMDLNLSRGNSTFKGLELISKKTYSPIILTSAYTDNATRFEALKRGAAASLSKGTFDPNSWMEVVKRLLSKDSALQARVFFSYVDEDAFFMDYLSNKLTENKVNVWVKDINQPPANNGNDLDDSDFIITILSPEAVQSARIKEEIDNALSLESENKIIGIIPLLLKPCEIPKSLESKRVISFVDSAQFDKCIKELMASLSI